VKLSFPKQSLIKVREKRSPDAIQCGIGGFQRLRKDLGVAPGSLAVTFLEGWGQLCELQKDGEVSQ
jgi:hypothetical protein